MEGGEFRAQEILRGRKLRARGCSRVSKRSAYVARIFDRALGTFFPCFYRAVFFLFLFLFAFFYDSPTCRGGEELKLTPGVFLRRTLLYLRCSLDSEAESVFSAILAPDEWEFSRRCFLIVTIASATSENCGRVWNNHPNVVLYLGWKCNFCLKLGDYYA